MTNTVLTYPGMWTNSDGLQVQFPGGGVRDAVVGSARLSGDDQELLIDIDWHDLPAFQAANTTGVIYGGISSAAIPAGALIKSAVMTVTEAFTSTGSSTITFGLVQADGTELDDDGLTAAETKANIDTIGKVSTGGGALIGTILAATAPAYYVWASVGTATFTAGKGRLKITYFMPTTNTPGGVPA